MTLKPLATISSLEQRLAITYETYKHEHPLTKKFPSDEMFQKDTHHSNPATIKPVFRRQTLITDAETKDFCENPETKQVFDSIKHNFPKLQKAIYNWSQVGYAYARNLQQGKKYIKGFDGKKLTMPTWGVDMGKEILAAFDAHFNELPSYSGPLVRDLPIERDAALAQFKKGDSFELNAHSSFTALSGYNTSGIPRTVRIIVEKNSKGKAVWGLSTMVEEVEVIVPKGQKYRIKNVEESDVSPYVKVYVEEI